MKIFRSLIILSCHRHRYPWPFLATSPYRSSVPAGPQGYTPYPHRATVCRFKLVALLLFGHVKGSIVVHHLWARSYFSNSVLASTTASRRLWNLLQAFPNVSFIKLVNAVIILTFNLSQLFHEILLVTHSTTQQSIIIKVIAIWVVLPSQLGS